MKGIDIPITNSRNCHCSIGQTCSGMSNCLPLNSYLRDIWPKVGATEKYTLLVITDLPNSIGYDQQIHHPFE